MLRWIYSGTGWKFRSGTSRATNCLEFDQGLIKLLLGERQKVSDQVLRHGSVFAAVLHQGWGMTPPPGSPAGLQLISHSWCNGSCYWEAQWVERCTIQTVAEDGWSEKCKSHNDHCMITRMTSQDVFSVWVSVKASSTSMNFSTPLYACFSLRSSQQIVGGLPVSCSSFFFQNYSRSCHCPNTYLQAWKLQRNILHGYLF